ncbi:MAG: YkgJ family cysteine cluster protein [Halanaerobiales bacterium]
MEIDPEQVKKLAAKKEDENQDFIDYLRNCDHFKIDDIVHSLSQKHLLLYDCTECANCCKKLIITLSEEEIIEIAEFLAISTDELKNTFVERKTAQGYVLNGPGCPFLDGNKCMVYGCRPETCSSFPHLHKDNINHRLINIMDNTYICPIVYNIIEELKEELSFKYSANVK